MASGAEDEEEEAAIANGHGWERSRAEQLYRQTREEIEYKYYPE